MKKGSVPSYAEILKNRASRIAVVGANNAAHKFGNIITLDLIRHGYTVLPVNPHESTVAGLRAYRTLMEVPKPIDIVNVVTPPPVTRQILKDAAAAGCELVWLQDRELRRCRPRRRRSRPVQDGLRRLHHGRGAECRAPSAQSGKILR